MTRSDDKKTSEDMRPEQIFSWPMMIGMLERIGDWGPFAFRLGVLQLIRTELARMTDEGSTALGVQRMRGYVEVLARLPWRDL